MKSLFKKLIFWITVVPFVIYICTIDFIYLMTYRGFFTRHRKTLINNIDNYFNWAFGRHLEKRKNMRSYTVDPKKKYVQLADYILNHYNRNSQIDKLSLAGQLERIYQDGYQDGRNESFASQS